MGNENFHVTHFIAIFTLLLWSGTELTISVVCLHNVYLFYGTGSFTLIMKQEGRRQGTIFFKNDIVIGHNKNWLE